MTATSTVEVFSAGCPSCAEAIEMIRRIAGPACQVSVHEMKDIEVAKRAKALGIRSLPAVVIDGELAGCCAGRGIDEAVLRTAVLGRSA